MEYEATISDILSFDDEAEVSTKIGLLEDTLNFREGIDPHKYFDSFSDGVTFVDVATVNGGCVYNVTLSDTLLFSETIFRGQVYVLSDFLYIYDWLEIPNGLLNDELVFVDTITGEAGPGMTDTLTFAETLTYLWDGNLVSGDTVTLTDGFSGFVNNRWTVVVPIVEERP